MARPVEIEISILIEAPPEVVWAYLVDWERLDRWMKEAGNIRVVSAHREGVGVVAEADIRIGFIRTVDRIRVSRWEPPHALGLEHLGWVKGDGLMEPILSSDGTQLRWTESFTPPLGPLGALGMRLWKPVMRRVFARDLRLLQMMVETEFPG